MDACPFTCRARGPSPSISTLTPTPSVVPTPPPCSGRSKAGPAACVPLALRREAISSVCTCHMHVHMRARGIKCPRVSHAYACRRVVPHDLPHTCAQRDLQFVHARACAHQIQNTAENACACACTPCVYVCAHTTARPAAAHRSLTSPRRDRSRRAPRPPPYCACTRVSAQTGNIGLGPLSIHHRAQTRCPSPLPVSAPQTGRLTHLEPPPPHADEWEDCESLGAARLCADGLLSALHPSHTTPLFAPAPMRAGGVGCREQGVGRQRGSTCARMREFTPACVSKHECTDAPVFSHPLPPPLDKSFSRLLWICRGRRIGSAGATVSVPGCWRRGRG